MSRRVAISPDGAWLAARLEGLTVIQVIDVRRDAPVDTALGEGVDFAVTAHGLWRLDRDGLSVRPLGQPDRVGELRIATRGQAVEVVGSDAVAIIGGARPTVVQLAAGRLTASEGRFDLAAPSFPLSATRILAPAPRGAIVHDLVRNTPLFPVRLTAGTTILGAAEIPDDEGVVMLVRRDGGDAAIAVGADGRVLSMVPVPRVDRLAIAPGGRFALLSVPGEVLLVELLTGASMRRDVPSGVVDLACSREGDIVAIVESGSGGPPGVVYGSAAAVFGGPGSPNTIVVARPPAELRSASPGDLGLARVEPRPSDDARPPHVEFRSWRNEATSAFLPADGDRALAAAVRHASTLIERLLFLGRNTGLLPRVATDDPLAHLAVTDADVTTLFASLRAGDRAAPIQPLADELAGTRTALLDALAAPGAERLGLSRIVRRFRLSHAAIDQLVLALAPDLDMRLGRLFGFLNNDISLQCARLGHLYLAGNAGLDCQVRDQLGRELIDTGLVETHGDLECPLTGQLVRVPRFLARLAQLALVDDDRSPRTWDQLRVDARSVRELRSTLNRELSRPDGRRVLLLEGLPGSGRMTVAAASGHDLGLGVELCDLTRRTPAEARAMTTSVDEAIYRAKLAGRLLVVRGDGVMGRTPGLAASIAERTARLDVPCCLLTRNAELDGNEGASFVRVRISRLTAEQRRLLWGDVVEAGSLELSAEQVDDLAARYATLPPGRIVELGAELHLRAAWERRTTTDLGDVRHALRELTMERLTGVATRYESSIGLSDLILTDAVRDRLHELVYRLRHRQRVLTTWQFGDKAHESYGVSGLFVGPAGTGKTAAAAAIANELEIDLYVVNTASIMSKWVGETEQNLSRVFDEAETSNVALLFDEADSLFGKRSSEQRSSSDRYANLTVNFLLTRMEAFSGLAILTTNLESAIDEAFQRRITTRVRFPAAEPSHREALWRHLLPRGARFADDVDLSTLSTLFALEGAHIQRALARAAFRIAAGGRDGCLLGQADLERAARAEYEDMGRLVHDANTRVEAAQR